MFRPRRERKQSSWWVEAPREGFSDAARANVAPLYVKRLEGEDS